MAASQWVNGFSNCDDRSLPVLLHRSKQISVDQVNCFIFLYCSVGLCLVLHPVDDLHFAFPALLPMMLSYVGHWKMMGCKQVRLMRGWERKRRKIVHSSFHDPLGDFAVMLVDLKIEPVEGEMIGFVDV